MAAASPTIRLRRHGFGHADRVRRGLLGPKAALVRSLLSCLRCRFGFSNGKAWLSLGYVERLRGMQFVNNKPLYDISFDKLGLRITVLVSALWSCHIP